MVVLDISNHSVHRVGTAAVPVGTYDGTRYWSSNEYVIVLIVVVAATVVECCW